KVHAYCLMRNHYHLALETPRGNLVAGIHWLQSTFGNRFNRFRGERGRAFQGRYRAILVEPGIHLAQLVDYIHLNPVRAGIVELTRLAQFRWSSFRGFVGGGQPRAQWLVCEDWLKARGGLADEPAGWTSYRDHLTWLMADDSRQKEAAFAHMSKGWAIGSEGYRKALQKDFRQRVQAKDWGGREIRELNQLHWEELLGHGVKILGVSLESVSTTPKSAAWKVALAAWLKDSSSVSNRWISEQLHMGAPDAVSRYSGEAIAGLRAEAAELYRKLKKLGADPIDTGSIAEEPVIDLSQGWRS
ncbi:MAG TPA: transposase, partial [Opitutaceae bacterium]|nr:transposase [Opitutaceae bacterium]